jgi:hypothetical protein
MPTSFNYDGKPGYIYNAADDTWYELSGKTDTTGTFEWAGPHTHLSTVTVLDHLVAKKGINNYLNPSERDASITSPVAGSMCIIRQDGSGNVVNELQIYISGTWTTIMPSPVGQTDKYLKSNGTISVWDSAPDSLTQVFLMMGG